MEDTADCLEIRPSALPVSKLFCNHNDDQMEHVEADGLLDGDPTVQEKNKKKKKKHKGGLPSPRRILTFNTSELSKLDEHKAEMKTCDTCIVKTLSKSASFPSNATLKENCSFVEGSGDSEESREYTMLSCPAEKISVLTRVTSLPLKSALRGGYEDLGIGPRPKLQVKWAPTVWEPPCSTISHTVNKSGCKKDPKHGKKGKYDSHKRQDKKKHHKTKCNSGSSIVRRHGAGYNDGGKEAGNPLQADMLSGNQKPLTSGSSMVLTELESKEMDASNVNRELATHTGCDVADVGLTLNLESSGIGGIHYPLESTCGGALFEPERVACNFLYRQAM